MTVNLRLVVEIIARFASIFFLGRVFTDLAPWLYLNSLATDDAFVLYSRNAVGIAAVANFVFFIVFFVFASRIARWIAPEGAHHLQTSSGSLALVAIRVVAAGCIVFGLVISLALFASWYLQTTSSHVSVVWYPEGAIRGGIVRGAILGVVGIALFAGSDKLAGYLARSRVTAV